jgi:rhodanese-related sulfurtransferase
VLRRFAWSLAALLLPAVPACAAQPNWAALKTEIREKFPAVRQVPVDELATRLEGEQPPLLIDVRKPEEYAVSHLPGAINASGRELVSLLEREATGRDVVLYCSVGYRSSRDAQSLAKKGFDNVANLEGSIFEWANNGHAVVRGDEVVQEVHPFNQEWGALLDAKLRAYKPGEPAGQD